MPATREAKDHRSNADEVLLGKINAAVAEHNAAEQAVTTAHPPADVRHRVIIEYQFGSTGSGSGGGRSSVIW